MLLRRDRPYRSGEYPTGSGTRARLRPSEPLSPWHTDVQTIRSLQVKEIIIRKESRSFSEMFLFVDY